MPNSCPCQSGLSYADCCQPYHLQQQFPAQAEQLMRSRYCAFALKNIDYIVQTTAPAQQPLLDQNALLQWAQQTQWQGLQIVQHQANLSKIHSAVEFKASFVSQEVSKEASDERPQIHHEHSLFVQINGRWYFVDPTVALPSMKQPCLCGSGKKFKHCCGAYL